MTTVTDDQKGQLITKAENSPLTLINNYFAILIFLSFTLLLCQNSLAETNPAPVFELQNIGIKQKPNYYITIYQDGKIHYQGFNAAVNGDQYAQITLEQLDELVVMFLSLPFEILKKYEPKKDNWGRRHQTITYKDSHISMNIEDMVFFSLLEKRIDKLINLRQWICIKSNFNQYEKSCLRYDLPDDIEFYLP